MAIAIRSSSTSCPTIVRLTSNSTGSSGFCCHGHPFGRCRSTYCASRSGSQLRASALGPVRRRRRPVPRRSGRRTRSRRTRRRRRGRRSTRRRRRRFPGRSAADRRSCRGSPRRRTGSVRTASPPWSWCVRSSPETMPVRRAVPQAQRVPDGHHIGADGDARRRGWPGPRPREASSASAWRCRSSGWPTRPWRRPWCRRRTGSRCRRRRRSTWLAVSTVPVSVTITPDPREPFEVVISTTDGTTWRYTSVTGSGVAVAVRGRGRRWPRPADVAEPDPSLNASAAMITIATTSTPAAATAHRQPVIRRSGPWTRSAGGRADSRTSGSPVAGTDSPGTTSSAPGARNPRSRPAPAGSMNTA